MSYYNMPPANLGNHNKPQPLTPLLPDVKKPGKFPIDSLPPLMRDAAKAIAHHVQAPLPLAAFCVIGAATHMAQTRTNAPSVHGDDHGMPCSLFMLTLADSGDRKSVCRKFAFREIDKREKETRDGYMREVRDREASMQGMNPKEKTKYEKEYPPPFELRSLYQSDASFSRIVSDFIKGISAASWDTDEGGAMFGSHNMKAETRAATLGGLVKLFDTGIAERDRARDNADGSGVAYNRRFSMMLLAQDVAVRDALSDPLLKGQGFLPRFLFTDTESLAGTRLRSYDTDPKAIFRDSRMQAYWERCITILDKQGAINPESFEVEPCPIELTDDANQVWTEFYNEVEQSQAPLHEFHDMRPFAGRAGEIARRLAAVFAHFHGVDEIDARVMGWACDVVRHSLREWSRYTNAVFVPELLREAHFAVAWLLERVRFGKWWQFSSDDWGKSGPAKLRKAEKRDQVLALLVEHGYLFATDGKTFKVTEAAIAADSAESAEMKQWSVFGDADDLLTNAENDTALDVVIESGRLSATFRNSTAA